MKTIKLTKSKLQNVQVRYYSENYDLLDSHFDSFDTVGAAIDAPIHYKRHLRYVTISNEADRVTAEYRVYNPCGVVLSFKRIS